MLSILSVFLSIFLSVRLSTRLGFFCIVCIDFVVVGTGVVDADGTGVAAKVIAGTSRLATTRLAVNCLGVSVQLVIYNFSHCI